MKYPKLIGVCKDCVYKCFRCEDPKFVGVYKCKWNEKKKEEKWVQEKIKI